MSTLGTEAIKKYYTSTHFEYSVLWNWKLKTMPALHFGYYDEKARVHKDAVVRANEVLAEFGGIQKGARVVDAGCGLGQSSLWLNQHYNANVTGITLVPKQVETIQKFIAKHDIKNVNFMVADYLKMPFEDNSVDIVWAVEALCHAQDKSLFYKEAFRVLKPGGKVLIAENLRLARPMDAEKEALLKEIFHAWAIPDIDTAAEHQSHAEKAGFKLFKNRDVTANMMISYKNLKKMCSKYYYLAEVLHKTGIINSVRLKNMKGSLKQMEAIEKGVFTYNHLVAEK